MGQLFADEHGIGLFIETSAEDNIKVKEVSVNYVYQLLILFTANGQ